MQKYAKTMINMQIYAKSLKTAENSIFVIMKYSQKIYKIMKIHSTTLT